jgi:hypothetical protein
MALVNVWELLRIANRAELTITEQLIKILAFAAVFKNPWDVLTSIKRKVFVIPHY